MKVLVVALLALLLSVQTASAQQQPLIPAEVQLDGDKFVDHRLRSSFMGSVFTRSILNEFSYKGSENIFFPILYGSGGFYSKENIKIYYPWMSPYLYPEGPLPKLMVINKWNKPVRITFGMPNQLEPLAGPKSNTNVLWGDLILNKVENTDIEKFKQSDEGLALEKHIVNLSGALSNLTGLRISYVSEDVGKDYSEIRINIIPLPEYAIERGEFLYKTSGGWPSMISSWVAEDINFHGDVDKKFLNGFPFTLNSNRQVDGYILSNSKNEIQMAFCFIWEGHDLSLIRMLVTECLVRAMGFPNGVKTYGDRLAKPRSYLTYWNDPEKWGEKESQKPVMPDENISEFDQFMIKTLYNPALKPGMDYVQAQKILLGLE